MGNDGGTIASRQDILSLHSYGKQGNETNQLADENENSILTTCALSSLPLFSPEKPPVVSDYKGKLYLKEKALEYIIKQKSGNSKVSDKAASPSPYSHIRSMNDLVEVHIKWKVDNENTSPSIECPVSKELKNNKTVYAYLRPCGCVLSFKFLEGVMKYVDDKNEKSDSLLTERDCPNCGKQFCFKYDVVILNPLDKVKYAEYNTRSLYYLQDELHLTHSKKPKKNKKKRKGVLSLSDASRDDRKRISEVTSTLNQTKKTKI